MKDLVQVLIDWINDELATQRIIVKDISEDLYDGQVLQKLLEMLTKTKLDVPEVTQSEEGQRQKLAVVLRAVNRVCFNKKLLLFQIVIADILLTFKFFTGSFWNNQTCA